MSKNITILICSPRGENSASLSLATSMSELFQEEKCEIKHYQIYKTLKDEKQSQEMIDSIDRSDILLLSSPLYVDCAPYMTIKLLELISKNIQTGKIKEKERLLFAISCAGYLEYYHNNIVLRIYEQFAKNNHFIWAGGIPIGAAGTYVQYPISKLLEMVNELPEEDWRREYYGKPAIILDEVMRTAVKNLVSGKIVPQRELEKTHFVSMPLEAYAEGGNKNWIGWAEQLGTVDKLRDKPYELSNS